MVNRTFCSCITLLLPVANVILQCAEVRAVTRPECTVLRSGLDEAVFSCFDVCAVLG